MFQRSLDCNISAQVVDQDEKQTKSQMILLLSGFLVFVGFKLMDFKSKFKLFFSWNITKDTCYRKVPARIPSLVIAILSNVLSYG